MQKKMIVPALALGLSTAAMGQTPSLLWTQRVHPAYDPNTPNVWDWHNVEVALGVDPFGTDVMVAWIHAWSYTTGHGDRDTRYNVSTTGNGFNQANATVLPLPSSPTPVQGADPMVVFYNDPRDCNGCGDSAGWVGSLHGNQYGLYVARKEPGHQFAATAESVAYSANDILDKC